jgi:hypothetical protein
MPVERENVETLMQWLAPGSSVRNQQVGADALVEELARVAFNGEMQWPECHDQVDVYREDLERLLATDLYNESQFVDLTKPDVDPRMFFEWFIPVVQEWDKSRPACGSSDATPVQDAGAAVGFHNPNFDGTPGTQFYKIDGATQDYLFADSADSLDWMIYEQRRYSEPTWDESWAMFYRVDKNNNEYHFAHAVIPGDKSSTVGGEWLSQEEAHAHEAAVEALFDALLKAAEAALNANPKLRAIPEEQMKAALMELAMERIEMISAQAGE